MEEMQRFKHELENCELADGEFLTIPCVRLGSDGLQKCSITRRSNRREWFVTSADQKLAISISNEELLEGLGKKFGPDLLPVRENKSLLPEPPDVEPDFSDEVACSCTCIK